jgi:subtilase family serine protease
VRYGPTTAQVKAVTSWLTAAGMRITADTTRYIAVRTTVATADKAFDTKISRYDSADYGNIADTVEHQPGIQPDPEEALDVETTHIAAPAAKVVLVGADCVPYNELNPAAGAAVLPRRGDPGGRHHHLADLVSSS